MAKYSKYDEFYEQLLQRVYGNNQEMCEWLMRKGKIYDYKLQYKQANQEYEKALKIMTEKGEEKLITKIKLSKAITFIKACNCNAAAEILSNLKETYKEAKQYKSAAICSVLLGECALSEGDNEIFTKQYKEAKKIVELHKINFGGVEIADSEYRIGLKLLKQNPKKALDVHSRHAFE